MAGASPFSAFNPKAPLPATPKNSNFQFPYRTTSTLQPFASAYTGNVSFPANASTVSIPQPLAGFSYTQPLQNITNLNDVIQIPTVNSQGLLNVTVSALLYLISSNLKEAFKRPMRVLTQRLSLPQRVEAYGYGDPPQDNTLLSPSLCARIGVPVGTLWGPIVQASSGPAGRINPAFPAPPMELLPDLLSKADGGNPHFAGGAASRAAGSGGGGGSGYGTNIPPRPPPRP